MHITDTHTESGKRFALSPASFVRAVTDRIRERRAIGRLNALDDHLLNDIGLSRGEIERAVRDGRI